VPWILYLGLFGMFMYVVWRASKGGANAGSPSVFTFGKSRGRLASADSSKTTFADVAGCDEAKEEVKELIGFLESPGRFHRLGARIPRGVLLVGPPGTGKTLLAKAVAGEAGVPFVSISGSEFVEMLVGVGAARVRDLFQKARETSPCIVFIDELDALGRSRGSGIGSNEEREQTLNQLLVEMDGFADHEAVVVIAATNRPEILDTALLRPGRFDRQVVVDVPDRTGRLAILKVHARAVPLADDVDLEAIAKITPGFAGADLRNLVNEAAILAAREDLDRVTQKCFRRAIDRVVAGLEKKNLLLTDEDKRRTAYHEVGHALSHLLAGGDDVVHKITIIPRGRALGFTMSSPEREAYSYTEVALRAKLVGLLGGRAAEQVVYGNSSTGDQNDLQRATDLARAMVVDYGMSKEVGPVSVSARRGPMYLAGKDGNPVAISREIGEQLADTIDREVRRFVDEALETATALLTKNRAALDHIADELVEAEVLEGELLETLMREAHEAHEAGMN
jgi:cell division protease FtsH